jgi:hypothetical protein
MPSSKGFEHWVEALGLVRVRAENVHPAVRTVEVGRVTKTKISSIQPAEARRQDALEAFDLALLGWHRADDLNIDLGVA